MTPARNKFGGKIVMKKMVKILTVVVAIAMFASLAVVGVSANTPNTVTVGKLTVGFMEDAPGTLGFWYTDALGQSGIAFESLTASVSDGMTGFGRANPDAEDEGFEGAGVTSDVELMFAGFVPGGVTIPANTRLIRTTVQGEGNITLSGAVIITRTGAENEVINLNVTVSNIFPVPTEPPPATTEEPPVTDEPTAEPTAAPTEPGPVPTAGPEVPTAGPEVPTGETPTAAPATVTQVPATVAPGSKTDGAPKGGVVLAIIPTLIAGAAVAVAAKKRK